MKAAAQLALSLAVATALVALLLYWSGTSVGRVAAAIGDLDPAVFATALGIQAAIYPLRAWRIRRLLPGGGPGLARLTGVSATHVLAANLLPAKLGEAALVFVLRREGVPGAAGAAVLVLTRLLDFAAVTGALSVACLALAALGTDLPWLLPVGALLALPALTCGWLVRRSERIAVLAARLVGAVGLGRTVLGSRVADFAGRLGQALAGIQTPRLLAAAGATLPIWVLVFAFYAVLARGFGIDSLTWAQAVFGAGLAIVATLLPLHGFAGFGVQDAGWVAGFTALGVAPELATSSGLAAHVVYVGNLTLFGLLAWLLLRRTAGGGNDPG